MACTYDLSVLCLIATWETIITERRIYINKSSVESLVIFASVNTKTCGAPCGMAQPQAVLPTGQVHGPWGQVLSLRVCLSLGCVGVSCGAYWTSRCFRVLRCKVG